MQLLADREAQARRGRRPAGARRRAARRRPAAKKPAKPAARKPAAAKKAAPKAAQALLSVARPRQPHAPPTRADVLRFLEGEGAGAGRNEILQALTRGRGDRAAIKAILRELADEGDGRPAAQARCGSEPPRDGARRARPCSTSPASTPTATCCSRHPDRPELRIVLPVENLEGTSPRRRRPGPGAPAAGGRGRLRGAADPGPAAPAARGHRHRRGGARRAAHPLGRPQGAGRVRRGAARSRRGASPAIWSWPRSIPTAAWASPAPMVKERVGRPDEPAALTLMTAVALGLPLTFPPEARGAGRRGAAGGAGQARGPARDSAGHHRRRGRARLRRRGLGRARPGAGEPGRPPAAGRDRRRRPLRPPERRARPRGAQPRQLGLFPRPGHPDAARGAVQRPVLAAPGRGPGLPRGLDHHRPAVARSAPGGSAAG